MSNKTLENCSLIKRCIEIGIGKPKQDDKTCEGYATDEMDDEPYYICKKCKFNSCHEK